jgi:hypothetical protein
LIAIEENNQQVLGMKKEYVERGGREKADIFWWSLDRKTETTTKVLHKGREWPT